MGTSAFHGGKRSLVFPIRLYAVGHHQSGACRVRRSDIYGPVSHDLGVRLLSCTACHPRSVFARSEAGRRRTTDRHGRLTFRPEHRDGARTARNGDGDVAAGDQKRLASRRRASEQAAPVECLIGASRALVAELVDALVSGISSRKAVGVQVPSWAP